MKNETSGNFYKKLKMKYRLKFGIGIFLVLELICACAFLIIQLPFVYQIVQESYPRVNSTINNSVLFFLPLTVISIVLYDRFVPWKKLSATKLIDQFIRFFKSNGINDLFYSEAIIWFSKEACKIRRQKQFDYNYADKHIILINRLYELLRYSDDSITHFLAFSHKTSFIKLCEELCSGLDSKQPIDTLLKLVTEAEKNMSDEKSEKTFFFPIPIDVSLLVYHIVLGVHVIACCTWFFGESSGQGFDFRSFLFYIPLDIIVILLYWGIIKDRQQAKEALCDFLIAKNSLDRKEIN